MNEVKEGQVYRHFKGAYYYIVCIALDSETLDRVVVYRHLDGTNKIFTRKENMFLEKIQNRSDNITGQTHRFEIANNIIKGE